MRQMKFLNLYLLSQRERRGLRLSFPDGTTVIQAPNGFGKSAVLKSLYNTFGATPHKVDDDDWRRAGVVHLVEFEVERKRYYSLKNGDVFSVFDASGSLLISTASITKELGPFLAKLLNFKLVMTDKDDQAIVPPPAYMFAPFYVDQDAGWVRPWDSFRGMFLADSKRTLFDYHLGVRPNEYYEAKVTRDILSEEFASAELERRALRDSLERFTSLANKIVLNFSLEGFEKDSDDLVRESNTLHQRQALFLKKLADLNEERLLWADQKEILEAALHEMDEKFATAVALPPEVECPACGQHYENSLVEQFSLVKDKDDILQSILGASQKLHLIQDAIESHRKQLTGVKQSIERIAQILLVQQAEVSLKDVISAEGRNEALRLLRTQLDEVDTRIGKLLMDLELAKERMKRASSPNRAREIIDFYVSRMAGFSRLLDVRLPDEKARRKSSVRLPRGSEGPRGLAAYYYACLTTIDRFGSASFCPVVIDAPNQQGQDRKHMPALMKFLTEQYPQGKQVIIASEELFGVDEKSINVIKVGMKKNQVLDPDAYEEVSDAVRPFLGQLL